MKILIHSVEDWTVGYIRHVFEGHDPLMWYYKPGTPLPFQLVLTDFDLIVVTEPSINNWIEFYRLKLNLPPVLAFQHGLVYYDEPNPCVGWRFDKVMVWGEMGRQSHLNLKLADDRILVTGNPGFDRFFDMETIDGGYVLIIGGNANYDKELYGPIMAELTEKYHVVYKPHPFSRHAREEFKHDHLVESLFPGTTQVHTNVIELIRSAKAVIHSETTPGIAAMIMKKPVLNVKPHHFEKFSRGYYRFAKWTPPDAILGALEAEINQPTLYPEFIKWAVTGPNSTARMRKEIERYA